MGYSDPTNTSEPVFYSGQFMVTATLTVTQATVPPNAGLNPFVGVVSSGDTGATPQQIIVNASDLNGDGIVNCIDVSIVKAAFGKRIGQAGYDSRADVNRDGTVDIRDLAAIAQKLPVGWYASEQEREAWTERLIKYQG